LTADAVALPVHAKPTLTRVIVAASLGNALEWFDFLVYGYFAVTISQVFFPSDNPTASLLAALGTFSVSFLMRPIGAILIGAYTDRAGRKAGLTLSILLMVLGTTMTALTPGYATIGLAAPILIFVARVLQGFSVGGEFGSAVTFLAEQTASRKGFVASWQWASTGITGALASAFGLVLTSTLSPEQLIEWGWRVPFLFGILIGRSGSIFAAVSTRRRNMSRSSRPARQRATCCATTRSRCSWRWAPRRSRTARPISSSTSRLMR
jgi:MFS transporter, MHS family, proline/betaine transporter